MKYVNANDILPEKIISMIQKYYQGGYLYIPKRHYCEGRKQTAYRIELDRRDRRIYLKHLEGRSNAQLGNIYHLAETSIRRIILKEKVRYQNMRRTLEQIIPLWEMESRQLRQIYSSAWEVNHSYVIKVYDDKKQLERNIKLSRILLDCNLPVANIVPIKTGETYVAYKDRYFLMSRKLQGSNISDIKDSKIAREIGCAIAQLHRAFVKCERELDFWDNSLLQEMKGWVGENLTNNEWELLIEEEYSETVEELENIYDYLPKQLIHRDVHFGNFLFSEGSLSGYIDFDLSQRNIRIFDLCYFLTGLLAEESNISFTKEEWLEHVKAVIAGYESISQLTEKEKEAIPCVMKCIEILFVAYYISTNDTKRADDTCKVFHFVRDCEGDMKF